MVTATIVAGLGACSPATDDIQMVAGHRFEPSTVTVKVGDEVTWTNATAESHTVTAFDDNLPPGAAYLASGGATTEKEARSDPSSGLLGEGETFTVTFAEPGTYEYFCIPHESDGMKGEVIVEP